MKAKNPSCNTTDLLNKSFKKGIDEGIRMVFIMVNKKVDQTFHALVSLYYNMKVIFIQRHNSSIFFNSVVRTLRKIV